MWDRGKVFRHGQMDQCMKAGGKIIRQMAKEELFIKMGIIMKESGLITWCMGGACLIGVQDKNMKENIKIIKEKALVSILMLMERSILESGNKEEGMVMDILYKEIMSVLRLYFKKERRQYIFLL